MGVYEIVKLSILGIILVSGVTGFFVVRRKVRRFNKELFGVEKIPMSEAVAGLKEGIDDEHTRPKSVSAMTSMLLPQIVRDFPSFDYDEMKARALNLLNSYLLAIDKGHAYELEYGTAELKDALEDYISITTCQKQTEHVKAIKIHRMEISNYTKNAGRCVITFQAAVESIHYKMDENKEIVWGSDKLKEQSKYDIDLVYIQDRDLVDNTHEDGLAINCPNCGAPIKTLGAKVCEYCGSPVIEFNIHAWWFTRVTRVI